MQRHVLPLTLCALALPTWASAAPIRVAVEDGSGGSASSAELAAQLNNDTWFDFTATVVDASGVDSAGELANYDVVILGDAGYNNGDWTQAMADALDSWTNAGNGGVVSVGWVDYVTHAGDALNTIDNVQPIDSYPYGYSYCTGSGSSSEVSDHPITAGLPSTLSAGASNIEGSPSEPDATNGEVLGVCGGNNTIVVGEYGAGRIAYLGYLYMANTSYGNAPLRTGDHDRLLEQTVAWVADAIDTDTDGDGYDDADDNCPDVANPGQEDSDADGVGDLCDLCEGDDATGDADADAYCADQDCEDADGTVYPGATELCDGQVNDCDGTLPDNEIDNDADGFVECTVDAGGWDGVDDPDGGDCDDLEDTVYPGASEVCDGQLNDCDGTLPTDETDGDGDGYAPCVEDVDGWDGDLDGAGDCDDGDDTVHPNAVELCDGLDNDCSGSAGADEVDSDGDGWVVCELDAGGWDGAGDVVGGPDCDDADADAYPGSGGYDEFCVETGCGCSSTPASPAALFPAALLGGLLLLRRRRR